MVPLQIRITDHEANLTAADVPYGVSVVRDMEFAFIVDVDGEMQIMSPYEFACHSKACAPPPAGVGGSEDGPGGAGVGGPSGSGGGGKYAPKSGNVGEADNEADQMLITHKKGESVVGNVRADGIMTEDFLDDDGKVVLSAKDEAKGLAKLKGMEVPYDDVVANLTQIALNSMNANSKMAMDDAAWYARENEEWGTPLAKEHGVSVEQVMGMASATSTNKSWSGKANCNTEVVENILKHLKEDTTLTITAEQAKAYNEYSVKADGSRATTGGGRFGPKTIEPGEFKISQLSSGTLARVMGSGYEIGGKYYTDGLFKAFAIARGELTVNQAIPSLKQRSFVNNLVHPKTNYSSTNDFWMARAMFGYGKVNITTDKGIGRETIRDYEVRTGNKPNIFLGTRSGEKSNLFAIGTKAAKEALANLAGQDKRFRGMLTHEFQAVVWVQMQREYAERGWLKKGGDDDD